MNAGVPTTAPVEVNRVPSVPGQFLVIDSGLGVGRALRLHDVSRPDPVVVLDLGGASPVWGFSADGTTLAYLDGEYRVTGVLRLDPAVWFCAMIGVPERTWRRHQALRPGWSPAEGP